MIQKIRLWVKQSPLMRRFVAFFVVPSGFFDQKILTLAIAPEFEERIQLVMSDPDNQYIDRVPNAGQVKNGKQIMHNGLKINLGSYYGPEVAQQLFRNRGVHEPQEERVFQEVLKHMKPGSVMIELGAFWSFYSMWFQSVVPQAQNYMVEPEKFNLESGQRNFKLNGFKGTFVQALVGKTSGTVGKERMICVDDFVAAQNIDHIALLHSDIQGFEFDMLQGASISIEQNKIDYFFISTHSNQVHDQCKEFLIAKGCTIIADANMDESYAADGLIVAHAAHVAGLAPIGISKRPAPMV